MSQKPLSDADERTDTETPSDDSQPDVVYPHEHVDGETPLVVVPRGGAREVGRSCYQIETPQHTYLVDCGLNQGDGGQFPDFRGLDEGQVDAVFLTHAHIDHTGALPVLEHRGLLADHAKVITTSATAAIAHVLLHDSLKIHNEQAKKPGRRRRFSRADVEDVLARFEPLNGYRDGEVDETIPALDDAMLSFEFGNAGHLLGSAWLAVEGGGRRVVFSGDLGGRSAHLPDIDTPPSADTLILESTYGDRDTHPSFDDARTELYKEAIDAIEQGVPVLIPTFAVGRAQEILQIFRERWRNLPEETREDLQIVYDGMATDATDRYHAYANREYLDDSIMNYVENAADFEPFVPDIAERPTDGSDRVGLLDGENAPIIVSPSGMLTGGLSPAYLCELAENYDEARIIFTGYQAEGTPGRQLQGATGDVADVTVRAWPIVDNSDQENSDDANEESDSSEGDFDGPPTRHLEIPTHWVRTIGGMSGHAARNRLLQFAREVDPDHIAFVHGDSQNQRAMLDHFDGNVDADVITRAAMQSVIEVHAPDEELVAVDTAPDAAHETLAVKPASAADSGSTVDPLETITAGEDAESSAEKQGEQDGSSGSDAAVDADLVEYLAERIQAIDSELATVRNDTGRTEAELRALIRDVLAEEGLIDEGGSQTGR